MADLSVSNAFTGSAASAGSVTAKEAFALLKQDQNALLIDVRTENEWRTSGVADDAFFAERLITLPWVLSAHEGINPQFFGVLEKAAAKNATLYFVCHAGARSADAAHHALSAGWQHCINVNDGMAGWHNAGLPVRAL